MVYPRTLPSVTSHRASHDTHIDTMRKPYIPRKKQMLIRGLPREMYFFPNGLFRPGHPSLRPPKKPKPPRRIRVRANGKFIKSEYAL